MTPMGLSTQVELLSPMAYMPEEMSRRVYATLATRSLPQPVFNTLLALTELSDPHAGSQSPIPLAEIQRYIKNILRFSIDEREIKRAVKLLIEEHGIAIGSARGNRHGYFFVATDEDAERAAAPLLAEIRSLAKRCKTLSPRNPYIQHLVGQMELGL